MNKILFKLLQKRGIKTKEELKPEERVDFDKWERVLNGS